MKQLVDLIVQACRNDFYFSHRIFFQLKSVTFEAITDVQKEEGQKLAVDTVLKNIYEMISDQIAAEGFIPAEDYVERLFLPNSRDLVRLLVQYNIVQFHPQLKGCSFAAAMADQNNQNRSPMASDNTHGSRGKLTRKIH